MEIIRENQKQIKTTEKRVKKYIFFYHEERKSKLEIERKIRAHTHTHDGHEISSPKAIEGGWENRKEDYEIVYIYSINSIDVCTTSNWKMCIYLSHTPSVDGIPSFAPTENWRVCSWTNQFILH